MKICVPKPKISGDCVAFLIVFLCGLFLLISVLVNYDEPLELRVIGICMSIFIFCLAFLIVDKFPFKFCNRWGIKK